MLKWHKNILRILLLLSFIMAIYFSTGCKEFVYDLSMAIFTSILIFYFIDYILEKYNQKEEEKKLKVVIGKITPSINRFYKFFVDIYAGTREQPVPEDSPVLKNIFYQKDELYQCIVKNLNYIGNSSYMDLDKFSIEDSFNGKPPIYLTWKKAWINIYLGLYKDLVHFQMYYGIFLSSELLNKLEDLIEVLNNFFLMAQQMDQVGANRMSLHYETNETFYDVIKLKEIMTLFESFVIAIQKESQTDFMSIDINDINNRDTRPLLGELLK